MNSPPLSLDDIDKILATIGYLKELDMRNNFNDPLSSHLFNINLLLLDVTSCLYNILNSNTSTHDS